MPTHPSSLIEPEVASTKRKKLCASVLLPDPVAPITPIFSPAPTANVTSCKTSGRSGASVAISDRQRQRARTADAKIEDLQSARMRPRGGRSRLDDRGSLLLDAGVLAHALDRDQRQLERRHAANEEEQVVGQVERKGERKAGLGSGHDGRRNEDERGDADGDGREERVADREPAIGAPEADEEVAAGVSAALRAGTHMLVSARSSSRACINAPLPKARMTATPAMPSWNRLNMGDLVIESSRRSSRAVRV